MLKRFKAFLCALFDHKLMHINCNYGKTSYRLGSCCKRCGANNFGGIG